MQCKNCTNFQRNKNMEAGKELSGDMGNCRLNKGTCKADDTCKVNGFSQCK